MVKVSATFARQRALDVGLGRYACWVAIGVDAGLISVRARFTTRGAHKGGEQRKEEKEKGKEVHDEGAAVEMVQWLSSLICMSGLYIYLPA